MNWQIQRRTAAPGTGLLTNAAQALSEAETVGYPVMLKSTAGGGGIGMQLCADAAALAAAFDSVQRTATASFGDARVYIERFVSDARHVEVQIFGDGKARSLHWANAIVRCSAATRRWWRKPRHRACPTPFAPGCTRRRPILVRQ